MSILVLSLIALINVKTNPGLANFAALRECVVGLDIPAMVAMEEQWEVLKIMSVLLKNRVNINLNFSMQNTRYGGSAMNIETAVLKRV